MTSSPVEFLVHAPAVAARRHASGIVPAWYRVSVAAAGLPLVLWQWRRARQARAVRS